MITGATKTKVDDIWQKIWEGGVTNPLEVMPEETMFATVCDFVFPFVKKGK